MEADKTASNNKTKKILAILKLAVLLFILIGVPAFVYLKYGNALFSEDSAKLIIAYLREHRNASFLIIILLQVFQVVVCFIPGQPIQFASSYMFGIFWASVVSIVGAIIGTTISFYISRFLGHDAMNVIFDEHTIKDYREKLNSPKAILIVFIIYLIPGIPKDLTSYAAGISDMRFMPFLIVSTLGRFPNMLASILFGHLLKTKNTNAMIVFAIVVASIVLVCFIFKKKIYSYLDSMSQKGSETE